MLDRARRALEQRDGRAALAELDRYQQAPSDHLLQTEANVIRVEALYQQGLRLEARRLATELLAHQPPGRLADRLRALVNGPTNP
jgi:urease accessory protein UreE